MSAAVALQEENTKLKQAAARQQQLLNQTKRFFEQKVGGSGDASVPAGAGAGGKRGSKVGGGSGASSNGAP